MMPKKNETGMPDHLKESIENLSGYSMDDVRVHYNSADAYGYVEYGQAH